MWVLTYFQGIHFLNKVKLNNLNNKNQHDLPGSYSNGYQTTKKKKKSHNQNNSMMELQSPRQLQVKIQE